GVLPEQRVEQHWDFPFPAAAGPNRGSTTLASDTKFGRVPSWFPAKSPVHDKGQANTPPAGKQMVAIPAGIGQSFTYAVVLRKFGRANSIFYPHPLRLERASEPSAPRH